jgi:hypothetical protein
MNGAEFVTGVVLIGVLLYFTLMELYGKDDD